MRAGKIESHVPVEDITNQYDLATKEYVDALLS